MHLKSFSKKDRYGNEMSVEFFDVPEMQIPEYDHPGDPKGTDTVPAWLTPGEYVVNAEAVRMFEPEIEAMNEAGRAVQREQGGTIPEYKAGGGDIVQGITDFFTMPPAPPGIEYRRMPDGSIGKFTEKTGTGGGQTYLGRLEEKKPSRRRREDTWDFGTLFNSQGGPVYAADGQYVMPDFLSDEYLDENVIPGMYATETSSGANVRPSTKGAIGPMQILPSTAANPGYGVQPRTLADIRSLEGSQQFAKDYLRGIHKENPDFTIEELVTAYHSGPDNVRKAKNKIEELGPQGQAYAGKVFGDQKEVSFLDQTGNVLSELFGFKEAQAATNVPPVANEPPKPDGLSFLERMQAMAANNEDPEAMFGVGATKEDIEVFNTGNVLNSARADEAAAKENLDNALTELQKNPGDVSIQKEITDLQSEIPKLEEASDKAEAENIQAQSKQIESPVSIAAAEEQTAKAEATQAAIKKGEELLTNAGREPDKPKGTTPQDTDANKKAVAKEVENVPTKTGSPQGNFTDIQLAQLKEQGFEVDENGNIVKIPPEYGKIEGYFRQMFKDLFSGPELARMLVMYAGSRALGYDHGGSLQYAMKQYVTRVDANVAAREKFVTNKDNLKNFTAASLSKYRDSGDVDDLIPKVAPINIESQSGQLYLFGVETGEGQTFSGILPKVKLSNDKEAVVFPNGARIPLDDERIRGKYQLVDDKLHNRVTVSNAFMNSLERAANKSTRGFEEEDKLIVTQDVADKATDLLFSEYGKYGANVEKQTALQSAMNSAIRKWAEANAEYIKAGRPDGVRDPYGSIEEFFAKERIIYEFELSPSLISDADPYEVAKLLNQIDLYSDENKNDAKRDLKESSTIWGRIENSMNDKNNKKRLYGFDKEPPEGHTQFSWWLSQVYAGNQAAIDLLNDHIKK